MFEYRALITDVYDADTVTADVDLGMHIWARGEKLRVARINAPEVRGESREWGVIARDFVRGHLLDKEVTIRTTKDTKGKYGRWIAEIEFIPLGEDVPANLSDYLVQNGMAKYEQY